MKALAAIFLAIVPLVGGSASARHASQDLVPNPKPYQALVACEAEGGWLENGPRDSWLCVRRATDAGRQCLSHTDCEGACEPPGDRTYRPGDRTTGRCAATIGRMGCVTAIVDGVVQPRLCM